MKIRVSATRMELLKLKRRLTLAVRGHRLLKDKQDELVRQFFIQQEKYRSQLNELWTALLKAYRSYEFLKGTASRHAVQLACRTVSSAPPVTLQKERILNLSVTAYKCPQLKPEPLYGLLDCSGPIENVLENYLALVPLLIKKAESENKLITILDEIEVTKRRVNALEYKLIPSLRDSITSIASKLRELELSTLTRLMRVKEIIEKELPRY